MSGSVAGGPPDDERVVEALVGGLRQELDGAVDAHGLLGAARSRAVRIRRRRTALGSVAAVLMVAAVPLGISQLIHGWDAIAPPAADLTTTGRPDAPAVSFEVPPEQFRGELSQLTTDGNPAGPGQLSIPADVLVTPQDIGIQEQLTRSGVPIRVQRGAWETGDQVCVGQPGGYQWNWGTLVEEYDAPGVGGDPGWRLKTVARALTVFGAHSQLRWLTENLGTCRNDSGLRWTVQSATGAGDESVLATTVDGSSVVVVGAVRVGAATSGFWLRVPSSPQESAVAQQERARSLGRSLLDRSAQRLESTELSEAAVSQLAAALEQVRGSATGK